jgi:hypothetical protein
MENLTFQAGRQLHKCWRGLLAGAIGAATMMLADKLQPATTKRPNSTFVPAHTHERLLGFPPDRTANGLG